MILDFRADGILLEWQSETPRTPEPPVDERDYPTLDLELEIVPVTEKA